MMSDFRSCPPKEINGSPVTKVIDYKASTATLSDGTVTAIDLPKSDVLQFFTADGTKVTVRPSGTEPKIKFYFGAKEPLANIADFEKVRKDLSTKIAEVKKSLGL